MAKEKIPEDVTRIRFPFPQNYQGIRDLFRYIAGNMDYPVEIQLHSEVFTAFGRRHLPNPEVLEDVVVNDSVRRIDGCINRADRDIRSAQFSVKRDFIGDSEVYTGIEFSVTPGYEPGELSSDDLGIMKDVKMVAEQHLKEIKKQIMRDYR